MGCLLFGIVCIVVFVLSNTINYTYILLAVGIACIVDFASLWGAMNEFTSSIKRKFTCKENKMHHGNTGCYWCIKV